VQLVDPHRANGHPAKETSIRMKLVRQRDTEPELAVRRVVWRLGARYRVCPRKFPGRPDLLNVKQNWSIFVHGCFWHGHRKCRFATVPRTNSGWWLRKIADNRARDRRKETALRRLGFQVAVVWECQTRDEAALERRLFKFLQVRPIKSPQR
jgi:DNA mismatch endonuclease (patch repair protein)